MKIQYLSDLHVEGYIDSAVKTIESNVIVDDSDVMIIAGDLIPWVFSWKDEEIINWFSKKFPLTLYIPGNHEYYGSIERLEYKERKEYIRDNFILLDNAVHDIDNVRFIGSTMWSDIIGSEFMSVVRSLNDFRYIKSPNGMKITGDYYKNIHKKSRNFIFSSVDSLKNNIVISHHLPSYSCVAPEFKTSNINSAFATDLDKLISESNIKYWIYGHTHSNVEDIKLNNTCISCNPFLDSNYNLNKEFTKKNIII